MGALRPGRRGGGNEGCLQKARSRGGGGSERVCVGGEAPKSQVGGIKGWVASRGSVGCNSGVGCLSRGQEISWGGVKSVKGLQRRRGEGGYWVAAVAGRKTWGRGGMCGRGQERGVRVMGRDVRGGRGRSLQNHETEVRGGAREAVGVQEEK